LIQPNLCLHPHSTIVVIFSIAAPVRDDGGVRYNTNKPAVAPVVILIQPMEGMRLHNIGTRFERLAVKLGQ
jgi:hypothetical protein